MITKKEAEVDQPVGLSGLEALSGNDVVSSLFEEADQNENQESGEKKEPEEKKTEIEIPEKKEKTEAKEKPEKKEEKKEEEEQQQEEEQEQEENEEADVQDELVIPGDKKTAKEKKAGEENEENEGSWLEVGKELNFELKEDTFDALKEAIASHKENIAATVRKELEAIQKDEVIKKYPVEAQVMIQGLEAGLTLEQVNKPFQAIDELLALSDVDLVSKDRELQDMPADLIEKEILGLENDGKLELEAFKLRQYLKNSKEEGKRKQLAAIAQLSEKRKKEQEQAKAKDADAIEKELKAIPKFMEAAVKDKHIKFIMDKWRKGEYQDVFEDPKLVAKIILYHEFGEQATGLLAQKKFEEGRSGIVNKLHQIPPKQKKNSGGAPIVKKEQSGTKNFEILENLDPSDL